MDIKELLQSIGYRVGPKTNDYYRMPALYRGGTNPSSLSVNAKTGHFYDFVESEGGPLYDLVARTLGISEQKAKEYLEIQDVEQERHEAEIEKPIIFNSEDVKFLLPSYSFYTKKGISQKLLEHIGSGLSTHGKMYNRFVFPIKDINGKLVGLSGRDVTGECDAPGSNREKWKKLGKSKQWDYPAIYTFDSIIKERCVILVESIGDWLKLASNGVNNILITFGTSLPIGTLKIILSASPEKIFIATNNDSNNIKNPGQKAAKDIESSLRQYFSVNQVMITPPLKNDFGEMTGQEIAEWKNKFGINKIKNEE